MNDIESQLVQARSALAAMNGQLASTPSSLAMPGVSGGGNPYASAQAELAGAQARGWTDSHPDVIALKRQIANLKSMGTSGSGGSAPNPAYIPIRSMQAEQQAMAAALPARKAETASDTARLPSYNTTTPSLCTEKEQL